MKYLLLLCLLSPIFVFSQFSQSETISELSPESKLLIEQSQKNSASKKIPVNAQGFNFAITTRFEGGILSSILDVTPSVMSLFNVTSLEFYIPTLSRTPKTRFLTTVRFSTPVLEDAGYSSLFVQRIGVGIGLSQLLADSRDNTGRGLTTSLNLLFGADFNIVYRDNAFIDESIALARVDLGVRFNYFIHQKFAVVFGLDIGAGFNLGNQKIITGSDRYPIEPLHSYGDYIRGFFTFGATIGFMF